ncbi:hypothetical protein [Longitalea luteola]|uniref:hypothetical protein n=1 Tax=Longitalea luteola TaxID=2812563 RepID=UPI001A95A794|nr:hypothetical protein [Longitalea luteola]
MTAKNETIAKPFIFSEKLIKKYTQIMQEKVAEHMRLQREGKLPFRKRIPVSVVRTGDVMIILHLKERQAQRVMAALRESLGKTKRQYITVQEFAKQTGIDEWTVQRALDTLT